jgi:hypothetical protein
MIFGKELWMPWCSIWEKININSSSEITMLKHRFFIILFLLVLLHGCAGIRVSQDYPVERDYSIFKTYAWQSETQEKTGDLRLDNPLRDMRIRSAVDKVLSGKGLQRVSDVQPDLYIAYQQKIYNRIDSDNGSGFLFGIGSFGTHGGIGFSTGNRVSGYDEAMLVIDIIDAESRDLIWRGIGTRIFAPHADPAKITKRINETVQKILAQFPPQDK